MWANSYQCCWNRWACYSSRLLRYEGCWKKNDMTQVLDCIWKYLAFIPVWSRIGFEALSGFASNQMLKVLRSRCRYWPFFIITYAYLKKLYWFCCKTLWITFGCCKGLKTCWLSIWLKSFILATNGVTTGGTIVFDKRGTKQRSLHAIFEKVASCKMISFTDLPFKLHWDNTFMKVRRDWWLSAFQNTVLGHLYNASASGRLKEHCIPTTFCAFGN